MTFSLFIALGAALGLFRVAQKSSLADANRFIDAGFWVLLAGLVAGRLAHVVVAWPYYSRHLLEIPQVWLGGLSGPGCMAGVLFALGLVAAFLDLPIGRLADSLLPVALPVTVSAWLACWWDGSAYGVLVSSWWGVPAPDEWGQVALRWPVQPLGALLALLIFWILDSDTLGLLAGRPNLAPRPRSWLAAPPRRFVAALLSAPPGVLALCTLFCQSLVFLGISFLRADPQPIWRGLRLDTWAWMAFAGLSALLLLLPALFLLARKAIGQRGRSSAASLSPHRPHP